MNLLARRRRWVHERFPVPATDDQAARTQIVIALRKSVIILALWMVGLSVLTVVVLNVEHNQAQQTKHQAFVSCTRSKLIAPYLVRYYEDNHALPEWALREYKLTIPKSC